MSSDVVNSGEFPHNDIEPTCVLQKIDMATKKEAAHNSGTQLCIGNVMECRAVACPGVMWITLFYVPMQYILQHSTRCQCTCWTLATCLTCYLIHAYPSVFCVTNYMYLQLNQYNIFKDPGPGNLKEVA